MSKEDECYEQCCDSKTKETIRPRLDQIQVVGSDLKVLISTKFISKNKHHQSSQNIFLRSFCFCIFCKLQHRAVDYL